MSGLRRSIENYSCSTPKNYAERVLFSSPHSMDDKQAGQFINRATACATSRHGLFARTHQ